IQAAEPIFMSLFDQRTFNMLSPHNVTSRPGPIDFHFSYQGRLPADALDENDIALAELMNELLEAYCLGHEDDPLASLNRRV
ncbi:hypothetical protein BGZ65_012425, partial [Modicella reniformis]